MSIRLLPLFFFGNNRSLTAAILHIERRAIRAETRWDFWFESSSAIVTTGPAKRFGGRTRGCVANGDLRSNWIHGGGCRCFLNDVRHWGERCVDLAWIWIWPGEIFERKDWSDRSQVCHAVVIAGCYIYCVGETEKYDIEQLNWLYVFVIPL